jgi:proline iminopeptidase
MVGGRMVGYVSGVPTLTTADGRALSWREAGSGPPLLMHPGGPGCSARYFDELPELEAHRTLLLLDPRGTGDSDRPADPHAYDLDDYAADIEALREHLGRDQLDVLGHSHGGFVAMAWAGLHPDRVGRLILASTVPRFTDAIRAHRMQRALAHQNEPYFAAAFEAFTRQQAGDYADDAELAALYDVAAQATGKPGDDTRGLRWAFAVGGVNADATRHFNQRVVMDLRPRLDDVTAPTLVLTGSDDAFADSAPEIADHLTDAMVVIIPGADHFAFLEPANRGPWSQAILDFLDAYRTPAGA